MGIVVCVEVKEVGWWKEDKKGERDRNRGEKED